ncbi:MAG: response regulator [Patescibacteria group bacterium]
MENKPIILLVDDEENFLEVASVKLRSGGFEVVTANNAIDAISKAEEFQPDLILSDVNMPPGISGLELENALRKNPKTSELKIAFLTVLHDIKSGNLKFLNKAKNIETLNEDVTNLIRTL